MTKPPSSSTAIASRGLVVTDMVENMVGIEPLAIQGGTSKDETLKRCLEVLKYAYILPVCYAAKQSHIQTMGGWVSDNFS